MPLKLFKRNGTFYVRGTAAGGAKVYRSSQTGDAAQAEIYRSKVEAEMWERHIYGEKAVVTFADAAASYVTARAPSDAERMYVKRLVEHFRTTKLKDVDQAAVDRAYGAILKPDAAPATRARGVLSPLCAILNHAARRGWCDRPLFEKPELPRGKTRFLLPAEASRFEEACSEHLRPLVRFLLCTGARLSEALELTWPAVDLHEARAMFWITKGGKPRAAALPPAAVVTLANLPGVREGHVFRRPDGEPYASKERLEGGQIKTAFRTACRRAGFGEWVVRGGEKVFVPDLTPHCLRHTWATWFYALSKDPFLLRDEGGWATVKMVERYAHLMGSEHAAGIAAIWGPTHPRIGELPMHGATRVAKIEKL